MCNQTSVRRRSSVVSYAATQHVGVGTRVWFYLRRCRGMLSGVLLVSARKAWQQVTLLFFLPCDSVIVVASRYGGYTNRTIWLFIQ